MPRMPHTEQEDRALLGAVLLVAGCVWFFLDLILLPPGLAVLHLLKLPDGFYQLMFPADFVISATVAGSGLLVRRSSQKSNSRLAYIAVFSCTTTVAIAALTLYGFFSS